MNCPRDGSYCENDSNECAWCCVTNLKTDKIEDRYYINGLILEIRDIDDCIKKGETNPTHYQFKTAEAQIRNLPRLLKCKRFRFNSAGIGKYNVTREVYIVEGDMIYG